IAYTSVLKRAIRTLWIALDSMDLMWLPIVHSWRLKERHYRARQGLHTTEPAARCGEQKVRTGRRAYAIAPDPLNDDDPRWAGRDSRYRHLAPGDIPATESLKDTVARVIPFLKDSIAPAIAPRR